MFINVYFNVNEDGLKRTVRDGLNASGIDPTVVESH